jgi:hypothetical protein
MNLYRKITTLKITDDWGKIFRQLSLDEGWDDLAKDFPESEERKKVILFLVHSYDAESKMLKNFANRIKDKSDIARNLELATGVAEGLVYNEYESANKFVTWWYGLRKGVDLNLILSGQELMDEQLEIVRKKFPKGEMDLDKWLKAMQLKNDCFVNATENQIRLDALRRKYEQKYSQMDTAIKDEINDERLKNSGAAERMASKFKDDIK